MLDGVKRYDDGSIGIAGDESESDDGMYIFFGGQTLCSIIYLYIL